MFLFNCSFLLHASPLYDALLYQDVNILLASNNQKETQYWRIMANITPQAEELYADTSTEPTTIQMAQAEALFLSPADPFRLQYHCYFWNAFS